ncbi:MAPEG family protein [Yunchengibacter salinarum]|uniref:MAPEG family protein n=1 Tax=Yunchengibacter salinarum TaxID=3133399 RepID=UPI0035B6A89D
MLDAVNAAPEALMWLGLTALLTAVLWVPYVLSLISQMGVGPALMDGEHNTPLQAPWAGRARRAHANAVENLAVFAALLLAVVLSGKASDTVALLAQLFFYARLGHALVYIAGLPLIRTLLFFAGFIIQVWLAVLLIG